MARPSAVGTSIFDLDGPSDYQYADASDLSPWVTTQPRCSACGRKMYGFAYPLVLEWSPGSAEVGDFVWTHRGRVVVRRSVGDALVTKFPAGVRLAPIEMVQDGHLRRPADGKARGKPRVWLPYDGEELVELVVESRIEPHSLTTLSSTKKCGVCSRPLGLLRGHEERGVKFDRALQRLTSVVTRRRARGKGLFVSEAAVRAAPLFRSAFGSVLCSDAVRQFIESKKFTNVAFQLMGETTSVPS